ncbi:MAG: prolyl oligopeptidase family serine peptidase [Pseudomonadota bacterium]
MRKFLLSCVAAIGVVGTSIMAPATAHAAKPVPLEYWAAPAFISNLEVSPGGEYVAFRKATSQKGDYIIEIYETSNMGKKPTRVGADSMDLRGFNWVGDDEMVVSFRGQVSSRIKGFNQGAFKSKLALYSVDSGDFKELNADDFSISLANSLVNEPDHVLVSFVSFSEGQSFRAPAYYRYNLKRGTRNLVLKGNSDLRGYRFDVDGNPRFAVDVSDPMKATYLYRPVGGSGWTPYFEQSIDSPETFSYAGLVKGDDNLIYVIAHNGEDRTSLWKYNLSERKFEEKVFQHPDVELRFTARHSNPYTNPGEVTGVRYFTDNFHTEWFNAEEEAIIRQFEEVIPNAHFVRITSRSRDGNVLVIQNTGPKDPGTFYLFNRGQFSKIGSSNGLLKPEDLSDIEYVKWTARDGKTITGHVTKPEGAGPFPLVVMPHGGPFISETILFDDWAQMFANNGYMVLQPQYRGSTNYGLDFYKAGFIEDGEGGKAMQDDKDDGVKYLIEKGWVDPDRVAMFGWSYGGYAALIAASRGDGIYQCAIAGAAVADNTQQVNYYRDRIRGWQKVEQVGFWDGSVNPIDLAGQVDMPLMILHGSIDQRVPLKHADKYIDALKSAGKDFEYIELKDADHFSDTLNYDHKVEAYPAMINFLKKDCGPGGL